MQNKTEISRLLNQALKKSENVKATKTNTESYVRGNIIHNINSAKLLNLSSLLCVINLQSYF